MIGRKFKYDVGFSFTYQDETIAAAINDLITERFTTFIYFNKQDCLAGRDGENEFNKVFGEECRLVVILYRERWGETPWTRIEKTAIKNRSLDEGYDFTLFIPVEKFSLPKWIPKNRLYFDMERYGIKTAARVIESKIQELGGDPSDESAVDFATRTKREFKIKSEILRYNNSSQAVEEAKQEAIKLSTEVEKRWNEIKELDIGIGIGSIQKSDNQFGGESIKMGANGVMLKIDFSVKFTNTLDDNELELIIYLRPSAFDRKPKYKTLSESKFHYGMNTLKQKGWLINNEFRTTDQIVDEWLKKLLEFAKQKRYS